MRLHTTGSAGSREKEDVRGNCRGPESNRPGGTPPGSGKRGRPRARWRRAVLGHSVCRGRALESAQASGALARHPLSAEASQRSSMFSTLRLWFCIKLFEGLHEDVRRAALRLARCPQPGRPSATFEGHIMEDDDAGLNSQILIHIKEKPRPLQSLGKLPAAERLDAHECFGGFRVVSKVASLGLHSWRWWQVTFCALPQALK